MPEFTKNPSQTSYCLARETPANPKQRGKHAKSGQVTGIDERAHA